MEHALKFALYLFVMAGVTYLVRLLPSLIFKKKIENTFIKSFLYYVPYTVLAAMTIPAIFYATDNILSAGIGFAVAVILAFFEKSLLTVACASCAVVFAVEFILTHI